MIFSFELGEREGTIRPIHGKKSQGIIFYEDENGIKHYFKEGKITPRFSDKTHTPFNDWLVPIEMKDESRGGANVTHATLGRGLLILAERTPFNVGNGGADPEDFDDLLIIEGRATITSGLQSELYKS